MDGFGVEAAAQRVLDGSGGGGFAKDLTQLPTALHGGGGLY